MAHRFPILLLCIAAALCTGVTGRADDETAADGNLSGSLVFPFSRTAGEELAAAERELTSGTVTAGLHLLQRLLDRPDDTLVLRQRTYISLIEAANHLIQELPAKDRQTYRELFGEQAGRELEAALRQGAPASLWRLTDQYRHTPAGENSAVILATLAFDRGEVQAAGNWLEMFRREMPAMSNPDAVARIQQRLANSPASEVVRPVIASTPGSGNPSWSMRLGIATGAQRAIADAFAEFNAQALMPTLTSRPVIVDGRIVTRTLLGLTCFNAESGQLLWTRDDASDVARLARIPGPLDDSLRTSQVQAMLLRRLIRDSLHNHLSADKERVYMIMSGGDPEGHAARNELHALNIQNGETVWRIPPVTTSSRDSSGDRGRTRNGDRPFFMGPPLVDGGQLLALAQRGNRVELLALQPSEGTVLWSLPLAQAVRTLDEDRERLSTACHLTKQGSRVFCPTAAGALICVDVLRRRIIWGHRHERRDLPDTAIQAGNGTHHREMPTRDRWTEASVRLYGEYGVLVAPDADRLFGFDTATGRVRWSRSRGEGMQVLVRDESLQVIGKRGVTLLNAAEGTQQAFVSTPRPLGTGVIEGDHLILPVADGRLHRVQLPIASADSRRDHHSSVNEVAVRVTSYPPTGLMPIAPRNLSHQHGITLTQDASTLSRMVLSEPPTEFPSVESADVVSSLVTMATIRERLRPWLSLLSAIDVRVGAGDGLAAQLLIMADVGETPADLVASLVAQIMRPQSAAESKRAMSKLQALNSDGWYVHHNDQEWVCRADRWLAGRSAAEGGDSEDSGTAPTDDQTSTHSSADAAWPVRRPTVSERATSGLSGESDTYFVRVPMAVSSRSAWGDVTVEVDRQGKFVYFHDASHPRPSTIRLPREVGNDRQEMRFLQAWAPADVLILRIGTELFAFQRTPSASLPKSTLWPGADETFSLLGPRRPLRQSFREAGQDEFDSWSRTTTGFIDAFGREVAQVGPVRTEYLCIQQRSHVIALDTQTGRELWRRSHFPPGTHCIGDDDSVILFRDDSNLVTVLSSLDGRIVAEWTNLPTGAESTLVGIRPHLVVGSIALIRLSDGEQTHCEAIEMTSGQPLWKRSLGNHARLIPCGESIGQIEQVGESTAEFTILDPPSGESSATFIIESPAELQDVIILPDSERLFVILSGKVTDRSLLGVQQIRGGLGRHPVNGFLHSIDTGSNKLVWSRPIENVAIPVEQPRHVPFLVLNDVIQTTQRKSQTGRLMCLDKRTGDTLVSLTDTMHVYYAIESNRADGWIVLRLPRRSIRLEYGANMEDPTADSPR